MDDFFCCVSGELCCNLFGQMIESLCSELFCTLTRVFDAEILFKLTKYAQESLLHNKLCCERIILPLRAFFSLFSLAHSWWYPVEMN